MNERVNTLEAFLLGELDPKTFTHREHMRMAFEMLARHDFAASTFHYSRALRQLTRRAGKPEVFNQTVTLAFLSLISERMGAQPYPSFETFAADNADLMTAGILARWYGPERLKSDAARRVFLLPDRAP